MTEDPVFAWKNCVSFDRRIEEISVCRPNHLALISGSEVVTYSELVASVGAISNEIASVTTPRKKRRAAVFLPRSISGVQSILACQRAGLQYIPVDTDYPAERVRYMLQDSRPDLIITMSDLLPSLPDFDDAPPILLVDTGRDQHATPSEPNDKSQGYIIYTSGSTGRPKGVSLGGTALQNILQWQCDLTELPPQSRTGQFAPFSFDVSFQEIFSTLCSGGTLVLLSQNQKVDPLALLDEIERTQINRLFLPFVALSQLVQSSIAAQMIPSSLREIHVAGEQLVISDEVRKFFAAIPQCRLFNQYGPSETHVVSCHKLPPDPQTWERLPAIGKAITNVELHVLGEDEAPLPRGIPGELYVTGTALGDGYVNQTVLTQQRFPVIEISGRRSRAYKTGDLVVLDDNGCLNYLGRLDQQIKFNGFRIDPGEIESVLTDHSEVKAAVVVFDSTVPPSGALYACVITHDSTLNDRLEIELNAFLTKHLPSYMLPTGLHLVDSIPKTPSGKIDRRSLLDQVRPTSNSQPEKYETLASKILAQWRQILQKPTLSMRDNVFEHGAKSIMVPVIQRRLLTICGQRIAAAKIFQFPTSRSLADFIEGEAPTGIGSLSSNVPAKSAFGLLRAKLAAATPRAD